MKITIYDALGRENPLVVDDNFVIEFGEWPEAIAVTAGDGGCIEVWTGRGLPIRVEPVAAHSIRVSVKTS